MGDTTDAQAPYEGTAVNDPTYVSMLREDLADLTSKATIGKVLGRNIERAAAFWALAFSFLLVMMPAGPHFFGPIDRLMALTTWGWLVGVISAARIITLIVNGWWPVTLQVRVGFSSVTLLLVWAVLTWLSWTSTGARGLVYPSAVLAPFAATVEVLCFLALRVRMATEAKGVAKDGLGHGYGGDSGGRREPSAGFRQRLGEAT